MSKQQTNSIRQQALLSGAVDWLLKNPTDQFSLRRLGADLNTSARMLVYHFGSRDALLVAVLNEVADRWMSSFVLFGNESIEQQLRKLWGDTFLTEPSKQLHVLSFQVWATGLATRGEIYQPFLDKVAGAWTKTIAGKLEDDGISPSTSKVRATLLVAAIEGLLLQVITNPATPVEEAFEELLALITRWKNEGL